MDGDRELLSEKSEKKKKKRRWALLRFQKGPQKVTKTTTAEYPTTKAAQTQKRTQKLQKKQKKQKKKKKNGYTFILRLCCATRACGEV